MQFYEMKKAMYLFRVMLSDQPLQLVFTSRILDDLKNTVAQDESWWLVLRYIRYCKFSTSPSKCDNFQTA